MRLSESRGLLRILEELALCSDLWLKIFHLGAIAELGFKLRRFDRSSKTLSLS